MIELEIKAHNLFQNVKDADIKNILKFSSHIEFKKDQFIFETGGAADAIYLILKGSVSVEMHDPVRGTIILESLGRGQFVGLSWLSLHGRWTFDARCMEDTGVVRIDAAKLNQLCESNPATGFIIMKNLNILIRDRLQAARLQLMDVYASSRRII